jgi:hypothetical protein
MKSITRRNKNNDVKLVVRDLAAHSANLAQVKFDQDLGVSQ